MAIAATGPEGMLVVVYLHLEVGEVVILRLAAPLQALVVGLKEGVKPTNIQRPEKRQESRKWHGKRRKANL